MKMKAIILEDSLQRYDYKKLLENLGYDVQVFEEPLIFETDDEETIKSIEIPAADLIVSDFDAGTGDDFSLSAAMIIKASRVIGIQPVCISNSSSNDYNIKLQKKIKDFLSDPSFNFNTITKEKTLSGLREALKELGIKSAENSLGFAK